MKCLTTMNINKLMQSNTYVMYDHIVQMTLKSVMNESLVTLHIVKNSDASIELLHVQKHHPDIDIVCESISDRIKKNMLYKHMGIMFGRCETRYVVLYKSRVAGSIWMNHLNSSFEPSTKNCFSWCIKAVHNNNTFGRLSGSFLDLTDALCIPRSDIMNSMEVDDVLAEYL